MATLPTLNKCESCGQRIPLWAIEDTKTQPNNKFAVYSHCPFCEGPSAILLDEKQFRTVMEATIAHKSFIERKVMATVYDLEHVIDLNDLKFFWDAYPDAILELSDVPKCDCPQCTWEEERKKNK